jgi:type II secretory pathway pseudopilin PulG
MKWTNANLRAGRGFTLVELLIVVLIMIILVAIGIGAMSALEDDAARTKTKFALRNAMMLIDEFRSITGRVPAVEERTQFATDYPLKMRFALQSGPTPPELDGRLYYYWTNTFEGQFSSNSVIMALFGAGGHSFDHAGLDSTLQRIPDDILYATGYGPATLRDGWGNQLQYAPYVTDNESIFPQHPRPFWGSAGPDGRMGNATVNEDPAKQDLSQPYHFEWATDNIYSFDLE